MILLTKSWFVIQKSNFLRPRKESWSKGQEKSVDQEGLPLLPNFLDGKRFFMFGELTDDERRQGCRYIEAFGGKLEQYMGPTVTHVLTNSKWDDNFDKALATNPRLVFASPQWIIACGQTSRFEDIQPYMIDKNNSS